MTAQKSAERSALDAFQSMVGETGPYPDDPQHPDPGYDVNSPSRVSDEGTQSGACDMRDVSEA